MLRYTLSAPDPASHLLCITIDLGESDATYVDVEFPAWSPGRYFIYDFARNVQDFAAHAGRSPLKIEKLAKGTWRVHTRNARDVRVSYRMYADMLSGTFSQLDDRHACVNGTSVFAYVVGRETEPIELTIDAPTGWKSYSSMKTARRQGRTVHLAANYDVLIDSPIEIGTPIHRRFEVEGVRFHVVMDFAAPEAPRRSAALKERIDRFVRDVEKTVAAYIRTFGRPDLDEYTFLVNIDPYAQSGDGMEHLASTRLVIPGYITDDDTYNDLVGVMSHEFFHIWNVKRLRPAELGPFVYTREHHTTLLWFAEGFTQYYGHLMLHRAGVWDERQFYKELAGELNAVDQSPGRFHRNLRESSFDTWHALSARNPLAATSNFRNTYVNYYPKGAVAGLMLDMEIRRLTRDRLSLDDVIKELYRTTYLEQEVAGYHLKGSGFTEADVLNTVERVAGRAARRFLLWLIESREEIDYARYLRHVGVAVLRTPNNNRNKRKSTDDDHGTPYFGLVPVDARTRATSEFVPLSNIVPGSPAEAAGLCAGDQLIAINGERVEGRRFDLVLGMYRAGETIDLAWFRGTRLLTGRLTIANVDRRPMRLENLKKATDRQKKAREKWGAGKG